mmetsp:Transcript_19402/g.37160  ORF Transcript_19402/g.37160 Transcript_19402/m.37160 type:complete len:222 (+) Transcript_19402:58-723(+)
MEPPPKSDTAPDTSSIIWVLDACNLEVAKVGKGYVLLNSDDHANFLRKHKKDPNVYRPDILHQALLSILDSPLNKAGRVKAIYVSTTKNVLFSVNPSIRIPRTFRRFCGLMVQLLQKLSIRSSNGPDKLLKVIKQPVTLHLPAGCVRVGFSRSAPQVVALPKFVDELDKDSTTLFVVGAFAHGKVDVSYVDKMISISEYPLSAACCISRICHSLENKWTIV